VLQAKAIEYGPDLHKTGFRQAPYGHLCPSAFADVVPSVRRPSSVLEGSSHVFTETHFSTRRAECGHDSEIGPARAKASHWRSEQIDVRRFPLFLKGFSDSGRYMRVSSN
jgi:hypothetical protein